MGKKKIILIIIVSVIVIPSGIIYAVYQPLLETHAKCKELGYQIQRVAEGTCYVYGLENPEEECKEKIRNLGICMVNGIRIVPASVTNDG